MVRFGVAKRHLVSALGCAERRNGVSIHCHYTAQSLRRVHRQEAKSTLCDRFGENVYATALSQQQRVNEPEFCNIERHIAEFYDHFPLSTK